MTRRSLAVAAAMALAMSQPVFRHSARSEPTDYLPPQHASHDAERIAKAEAKRATAPADDTPPVERCPKTLVMLEAAA